MADATEAGDRPKRRNPIEWHGSRPRGGFAQIPNAFLRDNTLSVYARCVGAVLFTHKAGFEVSAVSMAAAMSCSRPTATKALKELQDSGWLYIQEKRTARGTRAYSIYHLHRSRPFTEDDLVSLRACKNPRPPTDTPAVNQPRSEPSTTAIPKTAVSGKLEDAERLVECCMGAIPQTVRRQLIAPVQGLIDEGQPPALIAAALIEWQKRSNARPGLLPHLVSDAIKERNSGPFAAVRDARASLEMDHLKEFGYRWNAPDPPDDAKFPSQIRAYMKQCKSEWLNVVSADIERKWQAALADAIRAANPGVEEAEITDVLFKRV